MLIRVPFGQFLEGHGKCSQSLVIRAHFSIRSKSEQLLLFGKNFSTDWKKFFRWSEKFFPKSSSYLNDFVYKRKNHIWFQTNFSAHGKNRKCTEKEIFIPAVGHFTYICSLIKFGKMTFEKFIIHLSKGVICLIQR